jgi:hypothetical protein
MSGNVVFATGGATMRVLTGSLALMLCALPASAGEGSASDHDRTIVLAQLVTGTPAQKLQKLLRPHAFYGERVTADIRAATGDPNIIVQDRRWRWGEIYTCNYIYLQGGGRGRALVCE